MLGDPLAHAFGPALLAEGTLLAGINKGSAQNRQALPPGLRLR